MVIPREGENGRETVSLFGDDELQGRPPPTVQKAVDLYNAIAEPLGWRKVVVLDSARRRSIPRAVKDYGGLGGFKAALERASRSSFLTGKVKAGNGHEGWKPSLDFFLQPKSIRNLLEGVYDDPAGGYRPEPVKKSWREEQVASTSAAIDRYFKGGK